MDSVLGIFFLLQLVRKIVKVVATPGRVGLVFLVTASLTWAVSVSVDVNMERESVSLVTTGLVSVQVLMLMWRGRVFPWLPRV